MTDPMPGDSVQFGDDDIIHEAWLNDAMRGEGDDEHVVTLCDVVVCLDEKHITVVDAPVNCMSCIIEKASFDEHGWPL